MPNRLRLALFGFALIAAPRPALADAKVIDVPEALAAEDIPNPPADEAEAAALHGTRGELPRVLRLQAGSMSIRVTRPNRKSPDSW